LGFYSSFDEMGGGGEAGHQFGWPLSNSYFESVTCIRIPLSIFPLKMKIDNSFENAVIFNKPGRCKYPKRKPCIYVERLNEEYGQHK